MKRNKNPFFFSFLAFLILSCSSSDSEEDNSVSLVETTLESDLNNREFVIDNVIACAASNEDPSITSVYVYPREGVTNISYYETESLAFDKNDFSTYIKGEGDLLPFFNGFLLKYEIRPEQEKWVIVTFEEEGAIHISNPIRLKQISKPTEYLPQNVIVASNSIMPIFTWQDGTFDDTAIYFQGLTTATNDILSATYTFEKTFQYYKLDNVVLNVTEQEPPNLVVGTDYGFTLLAVSEDNWVNLFSEILFKVE